MKKILFFIATAIAFASCSSDDETASRTEFESSENLVGSWYESQTYNEEITFYKSGTYYDKACHYLGGREIEGMWNFDPSTMQLTEDYDFLGAGQVTYATLSNMTKESFVYNMTSPAVASFTYERIISTNTLEVGETLDVASIASDNGYQMLSTSSTNSRIASVDDYGVVTAMGEKGTAYIKIGLTNCNVWVKVVVGDDCADLWYDYPSLIGASMSQVENACGGKAVENDADEGYYYSLSQYSDYVDALAFWYENGSVKTIGMVLKEGYPKTKIENYLSSHYYSYFKISSAGYKYYTTNQTVSGSAAVIVYDPTNGTVFFMENSFLQYDLWDDYTADFGKTADQITSKYGTPYYSTSTSLYYSQSNDYVSLVSFALKASTNKVYAVSVFLNKYVRSLTILNYLQSKYYTYEKGTDSSSGNYAFLDKSTLSASTIGITYDVSNGLITYVDLAAQ